MVDERFSAVVREEEVGKSRAGNGWRFTLSSPFPFPCLNDWISPLHLGSSWYSECREALLGAFGMDKS